MTAYRLKVEAKQYEGAENVVVERAPHCGSLPHLVRAAVFDNAPWSRRNVIFRSFALCGNRLSVGTSDLFNELRSNGRYNDDDSEVKPYIRLPVPLLVPSQHEDRFSRPRVGYAQKRCCKEPHMTVTSCTGAAGILRRGKLDCGPCLELVLAQSQSKRPRPPPDEVLREERGICQQVRR